MAFMFRVTYQQYMQDPANLVVDDETAVKIWQNQASELMLEADCQAEFWRLLAYARRTRQTVIRGVKMWQSDVLVPTYIDVSATHLPPP